MSIKTWEELIAGETDLADATAVASTTTETVLFPNITVPANYLSAGRKVRYRASGKLSTTATPTMTWALRWGGVSGTVICTSAAITMGSGVSNVIWNVDVTITVRSSGATGTVFVIGTVSCGSAATLINQMGSAGAATPAAVTVDLTADTALSLTADWSANSASNTITGMSRELEALR